jgi:hypothetical protein
MPFLNAAVRKIPSSYDKEEVFQRRVDHSFRSDSCLRRHISTVLSASQFQIVLQLIVTLLNCAIAL